MTEQTVSEFEAESMRLIRAVTERTMRWNFRMWGFGEAVAIRTDMGQIDRPLLALAALRALEAVHRAEEIEVFLDRQIAIERERLRHVADVLSYGFAL